MAASTSARVCVIAVDGSKNSDRALQWYNDNVHKIGDKVYLVHCTDPRKHISREDMTVSSIDADALKQAFTDEEKKSRQVMEKCQEECKKLGLKDVELVKVVGEPGPGIVQASREKNADLIVTGCRGLGQIRRTILGSVSDYILHHSDVPVFVCKH